MLIKNPILTGFHADPCICRKGDDYYIAVSSFEWFPGIPVYHSRDMKHWELYTHVLTDEKTCDLRRLPSAKGIWAPCLTWCEAEGLFYVVYGIMNSMNARYFDIDNYLITAPDIRGPWSKPVYLHSSGFDASLFHDDDGRKWLVSLDWETRTDYEKPGAICLVEYDPEAKKIKGLPKRIWRGGTERGCLEGPHLTKRNGYYYLMCAEGGTGYYHCVTMARAREPFGIYEGDPTNPILTAVPENKNERADTDHLKPRYYNPASYLQKCGHGSYVETSLGETYLVHLCSRPFTPELRCTLGRETSIQKMVWTQDGWLRLATGDNMAQTFVEGSDLPDWQPEKLPEKDDFDSTTLGIRYYTPRISANGFCDLKSRPGWVRIRGQEAACSLNRVSLLAQKLTSVNAEVVTKMDFSPEVYQHSAGLVLYYDNMNYAFLRKYYSDTSGSPALSVERINNGEKSDYSRIPCTANEASVWMKLRIKGRESQFSWSPDGDKWEEIGPAFDTSEFSDEYSRYGEFTGCFVGLLCSDQVKHEKYADFDFFSYRDLAPELLPGAPTTY
jgi:xylan 1,4-beta-xylosidase